MSRLSVVLIAKNAEAHLKACLDAVSFADEIIVLEHGSTDSTVAICKEKGVRLYHTDDWLGFGIQKNRALAFATYEWILSLDTDEIVLPELGSEIQEIVRGHRGEGYNAFTMNRLTLYCGRWMRHSGWYPDPVLRLFRRGSGKFTDSQVHEKVQVEGKIGHLSSAPLQHYSYDNLEQVVDKINTYTTAAAKERAARGGSASISQAMIHAFATFIRVYIIKRGFLDGGQGFILAVASAEATWYRYLKLWFISNKIKPPDH